MITLLSISLVLFLILPSAASADFAPDRVIIKYQSPDGSGDTSALTDGLIHAEILSNYSGFVSGLYALKLPSTVPVPEAIAYYRNITGVEYVEPDYYLSAVIETPLPAATLHTGGANASAPSQASSPASIAGLISGFVCAAVVLRKK